MKNAIRLFASTALRTAVLTLLIVGVPVQAQTALSDIPLYSASNVPANLMLALSVEWPTGVVAAYTDAAIPLVYTDVNGVTQTITCGGLKSSYGVCYFPAMHYLGYFDWNKCYSYSTTNNYFSPVSMTYTAGTVPTCGSSYWSGNMLNWATMTKLDEFRQTLTGGYRVVTTNSTSPAVNINGDAVGLTVLQRARDTGQGGGSSPPVKHLDVTDNVVPSSVIGDATFKTAANVYIRSNAGSTELTNGSDRGVFFQAADNTCFLNQTSNSTCTSASANHMVQYYARVQVCVPGLLESNCNSAHASKDYPGAGSYNKPEGLIQQNFQRIRVGTTAYVNATGVAHPNGMVRALLHDNGPTTYNGFGARQPNTSTSAVGGEEEWDPGTGIFTTNPDPISATASKVPFSGAINFLNQFGTIEPKYESNDTISELYWATLSYYKKLTLDPSYTSNVPPAGDSQLDGFPVITTPNDPIQYSCQSNTIVTIGDSHTWYDTAVPGAYNLSVSGHTPLPAVPASGSDPGLNTQQYVSALGSLPLIEANGASSPANPADPKSMTGYAGSDISTITVKGNGTSGDTYNIAGMAYYAHTQNMRPDLIDNNPDLKGNLVTVDTYSVDVMEPGPFDGSSSNPTYDPGSLASGHGPNQYWLTAKFGGFDVDQTQCIAGSPLLSTCVTVGSTQVPTPESFLSWHTNSTSALNKDLRPDNYFPGNRPDLIQSGLSTIFGRLSSTKTLSASAPGVSSGRLLAPVAVGDVFKSNVVGFPIYQNNYKPGNWTGELMGYVGVIAGATVVPAAGSVNWSAQQQLDSLTQSATAATPPVIVGWNTGRRVITYNNSTNKGVPFRYASLSTSEQAALPGDTSLSSPLLNFLRGDKSNEGTKFRVRRHVLGDIVDSSPVLVQGALSPSYSDAANPGYSTFTASVKNRAPVVYIGANDGMLHAFAGDFSGSPSPPAVAPPNPLGGGGSELFAYVPSLLFNGPSLPATPGIDGLAALGNLNGITPNVYKHHFYVDRTPVVADVDFDWTCLTPGTACTAGTVPNWHTMLVGALGKGGKGIYALDVTTVPSAVDQTSGTALETTIANQVLWEFTDPDMGYTYGRPVVAKTRKYGWVVLITSGYSNVSGTGADGHGRMYVLNAKTGKLLESFDTGVGSVANPSGLGSAWGYTQDLTDDTVEQVYAGDLLGNVWRFDLSSAASTAYPAPTLLATLTDPSGNPQPITTTPRVELDIDNTGLNTRRWVFVGTGKFLDTSDLTNNQQQTMYALRDGTGSAPSTMGLPLTRAVLTKTDLLTNQNLPDSASGWYYDLPGKANVVGGATERIVVDPDAVAGAFVVAWTSMVPTTDPCSYHGAVYAAGFGSGQSALSIGGALVASTTTTTGAPTGVEIVQTPGASTFQILIPSTSVSDPVLIQGLLNSGSGINLSRVNWREILN